MFFVVWYLYYRIDLLACAYTDILDSSISIIFPLLSDINDKVKNLSINDQYLLPAISITNVLTNEYLMSEIDYHKFSIEDHIFFDVCTKNVFLIYSLKYKFIEKSKVNLSLRQHHTSKMISKETTIFKNASIMSSST